ncbi:MAG TPA: response regulator, partial [Acidobacteriota bacterium]
KSAGPEKGSTFILSLPIGTSLFQTNPLKQEGGKSEKDPQITKQLSGLNVLVVDDQPETIQALQLSLKEASAEVRSAASASEAIDVLKSWTPDVLISDLVLPEQDGYSFIKQFRAIKTFQKYIPALALSGNKSQNEAADVLSSGFEMFLAKPVEGAEVIAALIALTRPLHGRKILFVEDDVLSAEMFRSYFESKGANTKVATRSAEALSILNDWMPDVLVSDLGLPEEDGFSLIKNLRSSSNNKIAALPAIAVTGYGKEDGERAIKAGFGLYLLKPIEPTGLEQAVLNLLNPSRTS